MVVSNINNITTEAIIKAIAIEDLENLILNAIKSVKSIIKLPHCFLSYDYLSKSPHHQILKLTKKYLKSIRILKKQQDV